MAGGMITREREQMALPLLTAASPLPVATYSVPTAQCPELLSTWAQGAFPFRQEIIFVVLSQL